MVNLEKIDGSIFGNNILLLVDRYLGKYYDTRVGENIINLNGQIMLICVYNLMTVMFPPVFY